ncbi:hypothetical protein [Oricola sp.]|uniref:hypothetical protein n=1 Tax=Oricola sp. TaxID=1979950 RepID=UPI0025EB5B90|nr:hypothetical protein [Oricola sp.]MCI5076895.1 hypothetical protein [Oricola sp.]
MTAGFQNKLGKWARCSASALIIASMLPGSAFAASCEADSASLEDQIAAFKEAVEDLQENVEKDFKSATSKSYTEDYFDDLDSKNKKAKTSTDLVNETMDFKGYLEGWSSYDNQQKSLPPVVTVTMSNAEEMAQAAMDDENTKLDLADLRCSQSTEDSALEAYLDQADDDLVEDFDVAKKGICTVVHVLANLQDKREKLNDIRENGYPIFFKHAKDKKTFGGYSRTIQFKTDLRMYPVYPDKEMGVDGEDQEILLGQIEGINLSYNTWFKFSDDDWDPLNLYQYLIDDTEKDDYICAPWFYITGSVKVAFCAQVESHSSDKITLKLKTNFHYKGDTKTVYIGSTTIDAPFGLLADISDMKEKKMQDLQSKIVDRISGLFGVFDDVKKKADDWQKTCS